MILSWQKQFRPLISGFFSHEFFAALMRAAGLAAPYPI